MKNEAPFQIMFELKHVHFRHLSKFLGSNLNFLFIHQLYRKIIPLFIFSRSQILLKYDFKVCISDSDYLMQCNTSKSFALH